VIGRAEVDPGTITDEAMQTAAIGRVAPADRTKEALDIIVEAVLQRRHKWPRPAIVDLLLAHREAQSVERQRAAQLWSDEGWVFADETGRAVNPRTDWDGWKRLLATAGVRDGRLHDARHTAATDLCCSACTSAMSVLSWSTTAMASRYTP
jgi:hypothetical protein